MYQAKMSQIVNSYRLILPKDILSHLKVSSPGSKLFIIQTPNGIEITPYNPSFEHAISLAEEIMDENKNVLKKLAE
jgi:hypothetical protein